MERFTEFSREMKKIFFEAISTGDLETVLMFLEAGIDPNIQIYQGWCPIHYAVYDNQLAIAHLLLDVGANPNIKNDWRRTPLFFAEYRNNEEMSQLLRRYVAN